MTTPPEFTPTLRQCLDKMESEGKIGKSDADSPDAQTQQSFQPTKEQVESLAKEMYCSRYGVDSGWPDVVNSSQWRHCARWHLVQLHRETEKLRSGLAEGVQLMAEFIKDKDKQDAELSTLRSQLDALKNQVESYQKIEQFNKKFP